MTNLPPSAPGPPPAADAWVTKWLSAGRFSVYEAAASSDRELALALYEWNAAVSAAFLHDLAHLEVGLRNAYNEAFETYGAFGAHWTLCAREVFAPLSRTKRRWAPELQQYVNVQVDVNTKSRQALGRAINEAGGRSAAPGKVVAQLMFGFWRYLSSSAHDVSLWRPYLHHAFPSGTARADVDLRVVALHDLRNRVAHHEPLLAEDLDQKHVFLVELAELIEPHLSAHISRTTGVRTLVSQRPR